MFINLLFAQAEQAAEQTAENAAENSHQIEKVFDNLMQGNTNLSGSSFWETHQQDIIHFGKIVVLAIIVIIIAKLVGSAIKAVLTKGPRFSKMDPTLQKPILTAINYLLFFIVCVILLDLLGINTTSILTLLGTCGLAIALSLKDTLSNIAAGIMLLVLRTYKIGDYVTFGSVSGTIKEIGFFCTKLSTADGLDVTCPNSAIIGGPVTNYSSPEARRVDIVVSISYADDADAAAQMLMEKVVLPNEKILKNPAPQILMDQLANSSVNLLIRVWTPSATYWDVYWDIKNALKKAVEDNGFKFPFPQCDVHFYPAKDREGNELSFPVKNV